MTYAQRRARSSIVWGAKAHNFSLSLSCQQLSILAPMAILALYSRRFYEFIRPMCPISTGKWKRVNTAPIGDISFVNNEMPEKPHHGDAGGKFRCKRGSIKPAWRAALLYVHVCERESHCQRGVSFWQARHNYIRKRHWPSRVECTYGNMWLLVIKRDQHGDDANFLYIPTVESRKTPATAYHDSTKFVRNNYSTYFKINDEKTTCS